MQAVVLAAGEGTRMRPLTEDRPKPLVEVDGRPLLSYGLERLVEYVDEFVIVVGYRKEAIIDHYGDAFEGVPITYVHQRDQLGLAHAVLAAESVVEGDFLVVNGDNVIDPQNVEAVLDRHGTDGVDATLLVDEVSRDEAAETGVFVTDDEGRLTAVVEKPDAPPSTQVLTGLFAFDPELFHACHLVQPSDRGEYELTDAIDLFLRAGRRVETVEIDGWRVNVNTPDDLERVERHLA